MSKGNDETFVITLRLETSPEQLNILNHRFFAACHLYNVAIKEAKRRLNNLYKDKEYKHILKNYRKNGKFNADEKSRLKEIREKYDLQGKHAFETYLKNLRNQKYKKLLDSVTAQCIAQTIWKAVEDVLFRKGKRLRFKPCARFRSVSGKTNLTGIRFQDGIVKWLNLEIPVHIRKRDKYVQTVLANYKIKYCRIVRKWHKHKFRYYIQLVMAGTSPVRQSFDMLDDTPVGIDIGTSTIAVVSPKRILFQELAQDVPRYDKEIKRLQRQLDRQRRSNNPANFNSDGTIRRDLKHLKGNKKRWTRSRRQRMTRDKIRSLYSKRANILKQSHETLANDILMQCGTDIRIENMQFQALQKRAKKTEMSKKTKRYKRKKRFGKSIANHAPSMFIKILNRKLSYMHKHCMKISTYDTKASQLNHITGEYESSDLSKRWKQLDASNKVQRDLYSAFLLMNCTDELTIDLAMCFDTYDTFKQVHDKTIQNLIKIKNTGKILPSCMGI